jgi:BTB/POZ domain
MCSACLQGETVPVHGLVLATASPYLAQLISSSSAEQPYDVIILDNVLANQVSLGICYDTLIANQIRGVL